MADRSEIEESIGSSSTRQSVSPSITTSLACVQKEAIIVNVSTFSPIPNGMNAVPLASNFPQVFRARIKGHINFPILFTVLNVSSAVENCIYFYGEVIQPVAKVEIKSQQIDGGVSETDIETICEYLEPNLKDYCISLKARMTEDGSSDQSVPQVIDVDVCLPSPRAKKCIDSYLHINVSRETETEASMEA